MATPPFPPLDVLSPPRAKNVLPRAAIPAGDCLCDHCVGKCCRYFSLPIPQPETWDGFDAVGRYLAHRRTVVYVESGTWFLLVTSRCHYLTDEDRCRIYHDRPKICREYTADECEYDDDWIFERLFETAEQVGEYADAILPPRRVAPPRTPATGELVLPIAEPVTWDDFDEVRWFLAHARTTVFVEAGSWFLRVATGLRRPADAGDLGDHDPAEDRPEHGGESFERVFETAEQVWEFAEAILPPRRVKRPKPAITVIAPAPTGNAPLDP